MEDYLKVLAFAALPAAGNFLGGLLAEWIGASQRTVSLALHAAAGVIFAVVGVELMPEALKATPPWAPVLAFVLGGAFFVLLDSAVDVVQNRSRECKPEGSPWMIYFSVAIDLFSDGAGSSLGLGLGLLLALGQVPADLPEGFATVANFKRRGVERAKRILLSASFAIPILLGATLGFWVLRGQPEIYKLSLLAFVAGLLVTAVVEEIVPEAHEEKDSRFAAMALVGGFALFTLISIYFE